MSYVKMGVRALVPLALLAVAWQARAWILASAKPPPGRQPPRKVLAVEVGPLEEVSYQVRLASRGTVRARTESRLSAEVQGRVVKVADDFRVGARVQRGAVLLETTRTVDEGAAAVDLEEAQVELARTQALVAELAQQVLSAASERDLAKRRHELASAQLSRLIELRKEDASSQAAVDAAEQAALASRIQWEQLVSGHKLLVLRHQTAEVAVRAAGVKLKRAQLALEHVELRAPFDGVILRREVEVGEVVSRGAEIGALFATDEVEVRLPLGLEDQPQLPADAGSGRVPVSLRASGKRWTGVLSRVEGTVDASTRQLMVVAVVARPYEGRIPLRVGTFVEAEIDGQRHEGVVVVPRALLQPDDRLLVVQGRGAAATVTRRQVTVVWRDAEVAVIGAGLQPGDRLCKTPVTFAGESAPAVVDGESGGGRGSRR